VGAEGTWRALTLGKTGSSSQLQWSVAIWGYQAKAARFPTFPNQIFENWLKLKLNK
jgi:hypothetical protein